MVWRQSSANIGGFPANREKYREQLHVSGADAINITGISLG